MTNRDLVASVKLEYANFICLDDSCSNVSEDIAGDLETMSSTVVFAAADAPSSSADTSCVTHQIPAREQLITETGRQ